MKKFLIILVVGIFVAALLAVGFGLFAAHAAQIEVAKNPEQAKVITNATESAFVNLDQPQVLGVSTENNMPTSEHYQIRQISFGGEVALSIDNNKSNLEISDVRSELLMTKDQKDFRFLISWKTNKLAKSEIEYSKAGSSPRTLKESGYGLSHSVVLSQLELSSAYTYVIKTTDQWGNTITSDKYAMYTSSRAMSVIDLITKQFSEMFGWVNK